MRSCIKQTSQIFNKSWQIYSVSISYYPKRIVTHLNLTSSMTALVFYIVKKMCTVIQVLCGGIWPSSGHTDAPWETAFKDDREPRILQRGIEENKGKKRECYSLCCKCIIYKVLVKKLSITFKSDFANTSTWYFFYIVMCIHSIYSTKL